MKKFLIVGLAIVVGVITGGIITSALSKSVKETVEIRPYEKPEFV